MSASAAPVPSPAAAALAADRCLVFANYVRSWRRLARLDEQQAARRIGIVSRSYIVAAEAALYDPELTPPRIIEIFLSEAAKLPPALRSQLPDPPRAPAPRGTGDPDGAGGDVSPVRRPPAPEGPDGPERTDDDDGDMASAARFGEHVALRPFAGLSLIKLLEPDQAARLGHQLIALAAELRKR